LEEASWMLMGILGDDAGGTCRDVRSDITLHMLPIKMLLRCYVCFGDPTMASYVGAVMPADNSLLQLVAVGNDEPMTMFDVDEPFDDFIMFMIFIGMLEK
jgi:hypothetical protein